MKTNLLLTLATAAAFTASAQSPAAYAKPVANLQAAENSYNLNSITTSEQRSTEITDTLGVAGLKWSYAGYFDSQNTTTGVYGQSRGFMVTAELTDTGYVQVFSAEQEYPLVGEMELTGLGINLFSINSSDQFDIAIIDGTGLVGQETFTVGGATGASSVEWFNFSSSISVSDTFYVNISPTAVGDSIVVFTNGRTDNLTPNDFHGSMVQLTFDPQGGFAGRTNYVLAGDDMGVYDSDWLVYPVASHNLTAELTASEDCIGDATEVTFNFEGNEGVVQNDALNVEAFFINNFASDKSYGDYFATVAYDTEMDADTIDSETTEFSYTFDNAGSNDISLTEYYVSIGFSGPTSYSSSVTLTIDECVTTSVETKELNVVWNQVESVLNFSAPVYGNVNVYSVDGKLVKAINANNQSTVALAELTAGIYVVEVINNNERSVVKIAK